MSKSKKSKRPSGVRITRTKGGGFTFRSFGPNAPDLCTVLPDLLGGAKSPTEPNKEPSDG